MSRFVAAYTSIPQRENAAGKLDAPAFHRNHDPIWSTIGSWLTQQDGDALEIGSGTGQHIVAFARKAPRLTWWPSDILDAHLRSIEAWSAEAALRNLGKPQILDLTNADWHPSGIEASLTAIVCINVLHIAPWSVSENLLNGAARRDCCAPAGGCSSTGRSCATASTPRPAMRASTRACAPKIPNGACVTWQSCPPWQCVTDCQPSRRTRCLPIISS